MNWQRRRIINSTSQRSALSADHRSNLREQAPPPSHDRAMMGLEQSNHSSNGQQSDASSTCSSSPTFSRPSLADCRGGSSFCSLRSNRPSTTQARTKGSPSHLALASRTRLLDQEEERLRRNRRTLDALLRKLGKGLTLNEHGVTYFPYAPFVIVIEVPSDAPGIMCVYTMVAKLDSDQGDGGRHTRLLQRALELNYLQFGTRGATLGVRGAEVNLCVSLPICSLTLSDIRRVLGDFTLTAQEIHAELERVKQEERDDATAT